MLRWTDGSLELSIDSTHFVTLGEGAAGDDFYRRLFFVGSLQSTKDRFVLLKTRRSIDRYVELIHALRPARILELGIFQGGGAALLALLARPEKLVALEYHADRVVALDEFASAHAAAGGSAIRAHYGVDQADAARLRAIADAEFGGDALDLVIDDASHLLDPTRASFNALFPRLRPGGLYVIEDWYHGAVAPQDAALTERLREMPPPLANLVVEIMLTCTSNPTVVDSVTIHDEVAIVRRGPADLSGEFDLRSHYWDELQVHVGLRR